MNKFVEIVEGLKLGIVSPEMCESIIEQLSRDLPSGTAQIFGRITSYNYTEQDIEWFLAGAYFMMTQYTQLIQQLSLSPGFPMAEMVTKGILADVIAADLEIQSGQSGQGASTSRYKLKPKSERMPLIADPKRLSEKVKNELNDEA